MGFEVWIAIVLVASGLSGWIGYAYARKGVPSQSELDALATELDEARRTSESVQSNVNEHFEQSALLFGKLAADYREFLDHFSDSAQALGLSESRARELIEQGFQPLLTHEDAPGEVEAEETDSEAAAITEVTVEMPEEIAAETSVESGEPEKSPIADDAGDEPEKNPFVADAGDEPTADEAVTEADRQRA